MANGASASSSAAAAAKANNNPPPLPLASLFGGRVGCPLLPLQPLPPLRRRRSSLLQRTHDEIVIGEGGDRGLTAYRVLPAVLRGQELGASSAVAA